jgi:beta-glucosidase
MGIAALRSIGFAAIALLAAAGCRDAFKAGIEGGDASSEGDGAGIAGDGRDVGGAGACEENSTWTGRYPYSNPYVPEQALLDRVQAAMASLAQKEKIAQMVGTSYGSPFAKQYSDVQRSMDVAGIRGFRFRDGSRGMNLTEDMDGAKTSPGYVTVFPVSMARAASFDLDLEYAVGEAIADEMQAAKQGVLLAPSMNLLRHPLWGRAQETYGEDPFHLGRMATAMVIGAQEHIVATAKHFLGNSIEADRKRQDAEMDDQAMLEIYGRHFEMVVQDGGVGAVMAAYNKVNGEKSTQDATTLTAVLRNTFGFRGFVLSDWWAMPNDENAAADPDLLKQAAVEALGAGLDVELPWAMNYGQLEGLVGNGVEQADIDRAASRVLEQKLRFKLEGTAGGGLASPKTIYGSGRISGNADHVAVAERAALEGMVLLENDGVLPVAATVRKIAVLGADVSYKVKENATVSTIGTVNFATGIRTGDMGSSRAFFDPAQGKSPFDGIKDNAGDVVVVGGKSAAEAVDADLVVVVAGLTPEDEGEEFTGAADRKSLALDAKQAGTPQLELIDQVLASGKPSVLVLEGGSVVDIPSPGRWSAVVMAWYPGQVGGTALGKLIFGKANFSGKLPFTWPNSLDELPAFNTGLVNAFDYYVGYRYWDKAGQTPLYPFGHGLSYTKYEYTGLAVPCRVKRNAVFPVKVKVKNRGAVDGEEIVMAFVTYPKTAARRPAKELKGFARVGLRAGEEKEVVIPLRMSDIKYWEGTAASGRWVQETGELGILAGPNAGDLALRATVVVEE